MRVNYGGELESLVHAIVEGGSKQQLRDILMAEVSRDLLMAEVCKVLLKAEVSGDHLMAVVSKDLLMAEVRTTISWLILVRTSF